MLRIAHATDIHWYVPPSLRRIRGKRLLGTANLWLRGRAGHFSAEVQTHLVEHLVALAPDAVVITGDLTAQALPEEFQVARAALEPVLESTPTLVMCGNHDVYTGGSRRERRLEATFGPWMHRPEGEVVGRLDVGDLTVLALDPCRPHWSASGVVPQEQLDRLGVLLAQPDLALRHVVLALHYPILDRRGALYNGVNHGLRNAAALIDVLRAAPVQPIAILHGHKHHGYTVPLDLGRSQPPIFDPGASGYQFEPHQDRAACMNLYTVHHDGRLEVERFRHDGQRFVPETGGAYASGR